ELGITVLPEPVGGRVRIALGPAMALLLEHEAELARVESRVVTGVLTSVRGQQHEVATIAKGGTEISGVEPLTCPATAVHRYFLRCDRDAHSLLRPEAGEPESDHRADTEREDGRPRLGELVGQFEHPLEGKPVQARHPARGELNRPGHERP